MDKRTRFIPCTPPLQAMAMSLIGKMGRKRLQCMDTELTGKEWHGTLRLVGGHGVPSCHEESRGRHRQVKDK